MPRFASRGVAVFVGSFLVGCGFSPGPPGAPTGASSTVSGGATGVGASSGVGLTSGSGLSTGSSRDVGIGTGGGCGQQSVSIQAVPPDILIIQDKSGSMSNDDSDSPCNRGGCGANSKWAQVSAALTQIVTTTNQSINWGLKLFSDDDACDGSGAPVVPIATLNGSAVAGAIAMTMPGGNTPTRDAVTSGAAYLATLTDTNPKYILLATDGLPNCPVGCAGMRQPSGSCTRTDNPNEDVAATQAIANASAQGYRTFVIGVGNVSVADHTLNQFAMAGGLPQAGASTSYYAATDPAALQTALQTFVGVVASCTISLSGAPSGFTNVAVSATDSSQNGKIVAIAQDSSNGWSYGAGMKDIILNGMACTNLKNGTYANFHFIYACAGTTICIDRNPDGTCSR